MSESADAASGRIFISYRREETAYPAAWLFDRLAGHFGRDQIFKDVDSIELGDDFVERITTAVGSCEVLLALIGGRWLTVTDEDGHRRLDNPGDFVRLEIEAALTRNVRVIPILVDEARMPRVEELPASLAKLARRQALKLDPGRFEADTQRLLRVLDRTIRTALEEARQEAGRRRQAEESQPVPPRPEPAATLVKADIVAAGRLVDAGLMILVIPLGVIALEALIRPRTFLAWPWWVIIAAGILGAAITLGGFRHQPVPATIVVWVMTWSVVYSLSVIGTRDSSPSTPITVLSAECIVAAVVSVALCIWVVLLLPKGIRGADPFLAIFTGCFSAALVLAAVALHTGQAGAWTAVGVATLAAALGVILTLTRAQRTRPVSS